VKALRRGARQLVPVWLIFVVYGLVAADCQQEQQPVAFAPTPPQFLQRNTNNHTQAVAYYQAIGVIDPNDPTKPGPKATLPLWKAANGFIAGASDVTATYFNEGDLRFGREMHCISRGDFIVWWQVACYVTNYGQTLSGQPGPGGPADIALHDAVARANPVATVAMEYDNTAGPASVQFYAYNGAGNYITEAALDTQGAKSLPGICQNCHGGTYDPTVNKVKNANFLPFDVPSFIYSGEPGYSRANQEESFRRLNLLVGLTYPTQAIRDLIDGIYPSGIHNTGSVASANYVPPGWVVPDDPHTPDVNEANAAAVLYNSVVRPYCRSCHIAQPSLDFTTYQQFRANAQPAGGRILQSVCKTHQMPHAEVTWLKFWKTRPLIAHGVLNDYLFPPGIDTGECGRAQ
jgi:hypothetical protein